MYSKSFWGPWWSSMVRSGPQAQQLLLRIMFVWEFIFKRNIEYYWKILDVKSPRLSLALTMNLPHQILGRNMILFVHKTKVILQYMTCMSIWKLAPKSPFLPKIDKKWKNCKYFWWITLSLGLLYATVWKKLKKYPKIMIFATFLANF